jgi:hypothetical protein
MAVATAPCEERGGPCEDGWPPLPESTAASGGRLYRCFQYYSRARRSDLAIGGSRHDLTNRLAGPDV